MRGWWWKGVGVGVAGLLALPAGQARAQTPAWAPATHPAAREFMPGNPAPAASPAPVASAIPPALPAAPAPVVTLLPLAPDSPSAAPAAVPASPATPTAPTTPTYATLGMALPAETAPTATGWQLPGGVVARGKTADDEDLKPAKPDRTDRPNRPAKSAKAEGARADDDPFLGGAGVVLGSARAAKSESSARLVSHTTDEERYNSGAVDVRGDASESFKGEGASGAQGWLTGFQKFWHIGETCPERNWFQSDNAEGFESFISPVTNPFLFEDPRSLTEVRPLVMFQTIPNSEPLFRGGNAVFFGAQGRLALTDRWSVTLNKLGFTSFNPGSGSILGDGIGFSEVWLGPKFTFWRAPETGTVAAAGAIFQVPTGDAKVYQDTGSGSVVPYLSFGQNFRSARYGSLNFLSTAGYSFRFDDQRSDYFYTSFHLDYDIQNLHKYYPLVELNWFHYARDGGARPYFGVEGRDLANFGAPIAGRDLLSLALGGRYRFWESASVGAAAEFPLTTPKDLLDFRFTLDFTYKY